MENKTYYDWLEISPKASNEVIEKAYKALVIKYHPDLHNGEKKYDEEIIKKINEAYSVLSDSKKRAEYDSTLQSSTVPKEEYDKLQRELNTIKNQKNNQAVQTQPTNLQYYNNNFEKELAEQQLKQDYEKQVNAAKQKAYHDAYVEDLKNRGYKIRYKKSFKDYLKIAISIIVILIVIWILWQIPFLRNWINKISENNIVLKIIIGFIKGFYEALYQTFITNTLK